MLWGPRDIGYGDVFDVYSQAEEMISDIKQAFKKNLANITWMDEETKRAAADKVQCFVHID